MKTLTVTFHHTTNYGASLQAYALQRKIETLGHENIVFEYPDNEKFYSRVPFYKPKQALATIYFNVTKLFRKKDHLSLIDSFRAFKEKNIKLTRVFDSMDDLRNNTPIVDCLITGSDQVWNMGSNSKFKPALFLDFGNKSLKRFSYAASIERLNYTDDQKVYAKQILANYSGISLREKSAQEYIESFTEYKCKVVLDPVFLLSKDEWRTVAKVSRVTGPYILCYQVLSNKNMQKTINQLKKKTGYPVVSINNGTHKWIKSDYTFFDVSPEEFLGFYDHASIVVSSSFHGTAFGVIFNKPTYSLIKNVSSNRASDLMQKMGLEKFLIADTTKLPEPNIDIDSLKNILESEIKKSENYLKEMLDGKS